MLKIDKNKKYKITKLWITDASQVDKTTWKYPVDSKAYRNNHGSRMKPDTKTGQINILMGMDSRINHGTVRTGDAMIRLMTTFATQVGFDHPHKQAVKYGNNWLNEGLIEEVA